MVAALSLGSAATMSFRQKARVHRGGEFPRPSTSSANVTTPSPVLNLTLSHGVSACF